MAEEPTKAEEDIVEDVLRRALIGFAAVRIRPDGRVEQLSAAEVFQPYEPVEERKDG